MVVYQCGDNTISMFGIFFSPRVDGHQMLIQYLERREKREMEALDHNISVFPGQTDRDPGPAYYTHNSPAQASSHTIPHSIQNFGQHLPRVSQALFKCKL